ncbi:hypothetical protein HO539_04210 [Streptococcus suis]|nr:hypothetical protein [Streptococcus suis]NRG69766.1 hypothetical protein [Streptococcus suis]HEL2110356.1 hypothetical protein [Streptococcus suis]
MGLKKTYHRKGLGRALMQSLEAEVRNPTPIYRSRQ